TTTTAAPTTTTTTTAAPTTTTTTTAAPTTTTTTAPGPTGTTTTTLPTGGSDMVEVDVHRFRYHTAGLVQGDFQIVDDPTGVASVTGQGKIPGANGGEATLSVNLTRSLFWTFGSISIDDPTAGISLTGYQAFGPPLKRFGNSVAVHGSWFMFDWNKGFRPYTISATITDNG
ncbi:MAG TPA: hypothetical protein VJM33_18510, partial [Microthrixaceae bacterium]|nr:hypothetical protein [Microthrixaceae bacterium]